MIQPVHFDGRILFEIETINGVKFLKKEDKKASKRAGEPVYIIEPFTKILNSDKPNIVLK